MTLSKCDKEEMGTEIKIAVQKWPTTAVVLCSGCGDGLGFIFWFFGGREGCYLSLSAMNCSVEKCLKK